MMHVLQGEPNLAVPALRSIVMTTSVCLCVCVCLSVRENISETTRAIFAKFLYMLPMAVAPSSSGQGNEISSEGAVLGFSHRQCIVQHRPRSKGGLAHRGRCLVSTIAVFLLG